MLTAFSAQKGGPCEVPPCFLLRCFFKSFVSNCWSQGRMGYPIFGRCLTPIRFQFGAILGHFGARAGPEWAGGFTRSARNSICSLPGLLKINISAFQTHLTRPSVPSFLLRDLKSVADRGAPPDGYFRPLDF